MKCSLDSNTHTGDQAGKFAGFTHALDIAGMAGSYISRF
jgi:hypothetical protein